MLPFKTTQRALSLQEKIIPWNITITHIIFLSIIIIISIKGGFRCFYRYLKTLKAYFDSSSQFWISSPDNYRAFWLIFKMPSILMSILLTIASMLILSNVVTCRPTYKDRIPNGHNVPNPCTSNADWQGVGHWRMGGSGPLNPFGEVSDNVLTWETAL